MVQSIKSIMLLEWVSAVGRNIWRTAAVVVEHFQNVYFPCSLIQFVLLVFVFFPFVLFCICICIWRIVEVVGPICRMCLLHAFP